MLRTVLKSKIHRGVVTDANPSYEGSIGVDLDLLEAVDLWPGEKVLVVSNDTGERLETYVIPTPRGSGRIEMKGGAARRIRTGECISIMAFARTPVPIPSLTVVCDRKNQIVRRDAHALAQLAAAEHAVSVR